MNSGGRGRGMLLHFAPKPSLSSNSPDNSGHSGGNPEVGLHRYGPDTF
jgi:hypothetical protein